MSSVERPPLNEAEVDRNPFQQFRVWLDQAAAAGLYQHDAMVLATATSAGAPTARVVLLRGLDERGFAFYTNYDSRKGDELEANPLAALLFYWPELERQVRIEGRVERTSAEESDRYFASRPYDSCLGAWASPQSQVIANRGVLERRMDELRRQYGDGPVPRPPHWGGYRVLPASIEFWQGRPSRLHDRLRYLRQEDGTWIVQRLSP